MIAVDEVGDAGALLLPPAELALVILPDPEVGGDAPLLVLGRRPAERLAADALACGFTQVILAPGVRGSIAGARELATGEPVGAAALVVYESACIHRELLRLMVEHPLEVGERYTLYDDVGRPTAWFTGDLASVPATMPLSEEIAWPEDVGPAELARVIYAEDRPRAEAIVRRSDGVGAVGDDHWSRRVEAPLLRRLAAAGRPLAQLELLALALALAAGALVLVAPWGGALLGALALLAGVELARLVPVLRGLGVAGGPPLVAEGVIRPFGHAAYTAALTYELVAEVARSGVADLVLLAIGGAAVLFSLGQARALVRRVPGVPLDLPSAAGVAERLGVGWPPRWRMPLAIEGLALLVAPFGPGPAWSVMVAAGLARLWRWFATPESAPPRSEHGRSR